MSSAEQNKSTHIQAVAAEPLLTVKDLAVSFETDFGRLRAVDSFSFELSAGETLGIVGESGCGKSVSCMALLDLLPKPAGQIDAGKVVLQGTDIRTISREELYKVRGGEVGFIFQDPMTALNPVKTIGKQLAEMYELHKPGYSSERVTSECLELLARVGVPSPAARLHVYPHQLSGGLRQRVMIAMALTCKPKVLIADEPTTALDATIQAQILLLLQDLQKETNMGIVMVTHDLAVVAQQCDSVLVMYAGRVVEEGPVEEIFANPKHPYTQMLMASMPTLDTPTKSELPTIPGRVPSLYAMPSGCRFNNRCPYAQMNCVSLSPEFEKVNADHRVRCLHHAELKPRNIEEVKI